MTRQSSCHTQADASTESQVIGTLLTAEPDPRLDSLIVLLTEAVDLLRHISKQMDGGAA